MFPRLHVYRKFILSVDKKQSRISLRNQTQSPRTTTEGILIMPKVKQIEKLKHPNSRKTRAVIKHMKKQNSRQKSKQFANVKINLLCEKIKWFQEHFDSTWQSCKAHQINALILKYLGRFDEELEQIKLKHSIGNRKSRQHANREDIIKLTINRELEEYNTCGLEIPNLLDPMQFKLLKEWNGELRFIHNFKLKRFSKSNIQNEIVKYDEQSTMILDK